MPEVGEPLHLVVENVQAALLAWYDRAARTLPWRVSPTDRAAGVRPDPYRVWLSEIMLQQTTTTAVAPYFAAFTTRWPRVENLAAAPREDVLAAWAGLGYYSRARNLHAAAIQLAEKGFPPDEDGWREIPGVGPYTAAAVAAIAYDQPANVVDGNVERVMARLFAVETPLPAARPQLRAHAGALAPSARPGDWAQALMDLGATVCTPRSPHCGDCPIAQWCAAAAGGAPAGYPRRLAKTAKPQRYGVAFALRVKGRLLLVRRPEDGLLGGMRALPTTPWREAAWTAADAAAHAPAATAWRPAGVVRHVFTHFALDLDVWVGDGRADAAGEWVDEAEIAQAGLPTVFAKAAARALSA
ncbi:MAG: A/G-specific adenine glycosylase [Alphaproteobacteria bacterium]|nr:A/G-specific adenine glycosylase [Alphaproteobacteria bacterium]